jgi:hypothetical protein
MNDLCSAVWLGTWVTDTIIRFQTLRAFLEYPEFASSDVFVSSLAFHALPIGWEDL